MSYDKYISGLWNKQDVADTISIRDKFIKLGYVQNQKKLMMKLGNLESSKKPEYYCMADKVPYIYDQGVIGSCTANSIALLYKMKNTINNFEPSRLYIYTKGRLLHSDILKDEGSDVIYGMDVASRIGICSEKSWPYDISKVNVVPPISCDSDAKSYKIAGRIFIDTTMANHMLLNNIKDTLLSGCPILTAIMLYKSFMDNNVIKTGVIKIPTCKEKFNSEDPIDPFIGGHEVLMIGYDEKHRVFICVNSWGPNWGYKPIGAKTKGYFKIPYEYILDRDLCIQLCTFKNIVYKDKIM